MLCIASLLCLDAPLVAVAWQALFAAAFAIPLSSASRGVLFLTTWAIYLFERGADAASLRPGMPRSARQRFAARHVRAGLLLFVAVVALDFLLILRLAPRLLLIGGGVGAVCVAYLAVNRKADRAWQSLPIKELSIGLLFAIGTVAALVPTRGAGFAPSVALFGLLCAGNCAFVAAWERELDVRQGKSSLATRWPRLEAALPRLTIALALLAALSRLFAVPMALGLPLSVAALLLVLLHAIRRSLPADERTALADLALLVPLLPRLWLR